MTQFSSRFLMGAALAAIAVSAAGCTGTVEGTGMTPPGGSGGSGNPGMTGMGTGSTGPTDMPPGGDQPAAHLHRLTSSQFANSLRDLFGAGVPIGALDPDQPTGGFVSVGSSSIVSSSSGIGLYEAAAEAATAWLLADPARASAALACVPQMATDTTCASQAFSTLGRRAYRRPLASDETNRLVMLATAVATGQGGTMTLGMQAALSAILQSPNFLYRVELGAPSPADGGRLKYDSYEMASRLASTLWNTVPDNALLDAAGKNGGLATADSVIAQAKRMLADPRAHQGLAAFVDDLYALHNLQDAEPDPMTFPALTPTLRAAMQTELEMRIDDMVFGARGDFLSLFDSKTTFVNNELATHYGLPTAASDGFRKVEIPGDSPRAGILGSGAILAGLAMPQRTAPTRRGKFIREAVLCQTVPPPPSNVVPVLPPPTDPSETMRQRLSQHRVNPSCASCHSLIDPLGFGLENFDGVGKYRSLENGKPVDATGDLDGAQFDGLAQMGAVLRHAAITGPCFVSKLYMNAQNRLAGARDAAILDKLAADFAASGNKADQLITNLVSAEPFRFVEPTKP
ncbi:MAG: hypothetical protein QOI66_4406 [Myxococcales bacterium]|nr:hypothetical protein [Myxococcales bacterium]